MSTQRSSHVERTAREPRDESLHPATLGRIDQVNERVRLLRLFLTSGPISFQPGQWLDTYVPGVPKPGGFTITSPPAAASPAAEPYLELAVQTSPENPPAAWLWRPRHEILGSTLRVRVGGSFTLPPPRVALKDIRRVVFVAGGVGINPLMSMMSSLAEGDSGIDVQVLYSSRSPASGEGEILFVSRIATYFAEGQLRGRFRLFITGPSQATEPLGRSEALENPFDQAQVEVHARRVTADDILGAVGAEDRESTLTYICGPPAMTDELVETLTSPNGGGLDKERVLTEKWW